MCGRRRAPPSRREDTLLLPKGDGGDIHPGQQVAVKESVLPFKRFRTPVGKTVDILLGPEMRSTGEVMGFDRDFPHAFAKSQLAAYEGGLPTSGNVFISVNDTDKRQLPLFAARLVELGFNIWATEGTASVLRRYGIDSKIVDKISVRMDSDPDDPITTYHAEGSVGKNVVQLIEEGAIDLILNTPTPAVPVPTATPSVRRLSQRPAAVHHHDGILRRVDGYRGGAQ